MFGEYISWFIKEKRERQKWKKSRYNFNIARIQEKEEEEQQQQEEYEEEKKMLMMKMMMMKIPWLLFGVKRIIQIKEFTPVPFLQQTHTQIHQNLHCIGLRYIIM